MSELRYRPRVTEVCAAVVNVEGVELAVFHDQERRVPVAIPVVYFDMLMSVVKEEQAAPAAPAAAPVVLAAAKPKERRKKEPKAEPVAAKRESPVQDAVREALAKKPMTSSEVVSALKNVTSQDTVYATLGVLRKKGIVKTERDDDGEMRNRLIAA